MNAEMNNQGTILVVDDTPESISVVRGALEESGYRVLVATSGEKALARSALEEPELILLDILMPGMDGYETCQRLKAQEPTRAIPIIFLSALTETFDKVRAFRLGATDYLIKPIATEELLARVKTHVTIQRLANELQAANHSLEERVAARTMELTSANQSLQSEIAERHRAEASVQQLNAELERRVLQRTAQLQAANQELDSFSSAVSHDLRAPLRRIGGFALILKQTHGDRLDEEGKRLLAIICQAVQHMGQLIEDLLAFSRMGRQCLQAKVIDMTAMVSEVFQECAAQVQERQLRLKLSPLPPAQADRAMIRQVWINLLSNAIKYTKPKDVAEIEVGCQNKGGEPVYFVKDNGVGFDMKYADKLFGVFQRLHRSDEFEGTGVGLALVQRIVHRHGGRIWAEAQINEGAAFYFTLPT